MPDFAPMLWNVLPILLCVGLFAAVVKLVVFLAKRWNSL